MLSTPSRQTDAPILDAAGLAVRYHTSPGYIRKLHAKEPSRPPPRLPIGGQRLLWRLVDVEAWESAKVAASVSAPSRQATPARRGPKSTASKAAAARSGAAA